ncbi:carbamoyltransferase family protein [Pontibacter fetidus]|uniref:Carbamoyltransferase n=1 Tax=Pontibacter fetidus TaxID=2700082 RepID=A0A6B2GUL9_9BACT|nr:carbamoyltransferase C-terminal domain-containing protein [Pontibacter fetidus]NDK54515.1 carbamoyltransferase [Pontibacter fetidus]
MYILGLNAYHGDSSASIMHNGDVIAASEEERFRRIKHWAGFPSEAVKFCLKEAGVSISEIDYITISRDPSANIHKKLIHAAKNLVSAKTLIDRLANTKKVANVKEELSQALGVPVIEIKAEIKNIEHHRSHMASAFFASPFDEAAILSIDGFGDFTSTMIGVGRGNKIEVLDSVIYPHSAGVFYTAFTQYLGFDKYGDEYKVMGLAPYGMPTMVEKLRDVLKFKDNGLFELNIKYFRHVKEGVQMSWEGGEPNIGPIFSDYLVDMFGPARQKTDELTQYHKDLAASVQRITEELIFHILNHLQKRTGLKNICIAGGVAQNSVVNGKVLANTSFESLYIPSAGHDAGTALGSSLYLYNHVLGQPRLQPIYHASTGSRFCNDEIEAYLIEQNISYTRYSDEELYERVTNRLLDAGVVGWFQGRAEFGPRALGHRSIIADPRRSDAKDLLNAKIKRRESFRPFAPSIMKEYVSEYFEITDNVPFMEKVFPIRKEKHAEIPAVTHVDGTGRLQTVDAENNPRYYNLIKAFNAKTNVPILLNTSFNENEPIVNTPKEALDCFLRTKMDMLVLENIVIER